MATQTKRAPAAAPSRPRRRCWRCPKVRRPNRATQLRLGLGAVAQAVATGRRLQPPVGALASVHQACRPSRREFRLRVVPTTVLDPSATFPAVLRAWSGLVFAGRRWSVGFLDERTQIRWFSCNSTTIDKTGRVPVVQRAAMDEGDCESPASCLSCTAVTRSDTSLTWQAAHSVWRTWT